MFSAPASYPLHENVKCCPRSRPRPSPKDRTAPPVVGFGIETHGDISTIARASYVAKEYVQGASELTREKCPISDLRVSTKCGESDTTTGLLSHSPKQTFPCCLTAKLRP